MSSYDLLQAIKTSQRVSSGRAGPKRWYPVTDLRYRSIRYRYAPQVFDTVDPAIIDEIKLEELMHRMRAKRPERYGTLVAILRELDIASSINSSKLSPYHNAIKLKDSITGITSNLIDLGYGTSQVLPILFACLTDTNGPLFIEQPEIHLHPKAQGSLAELICYTSCYRQIVVETHSVHLINRARILIAKGILRPENVVINYVYRTKKGSKVISIPILKNGEFGKDWPEGFFDERYQDTLSLLKLKGEKES